MEGELHMGPIRRYRTHVIAHGLRTGHYEKLSRHIRLVAHSSRYTVARWSPSDYKFNCYISCKRNMYITMSFTRGLFNPWILGKFLRNDNLASSLFIWCKIRFWRNSMWWIVFFNCRVPFKYVQRLQICILQSWSILALFTSIHLIRLWLKIVYGADRDDISGLTWKWNRMQKLHHNYFRYRDIFSSIYIFVLSDH